MALPPSRGAPASPLEVAGASAIGVGVASVIFEGSPGTGVGFGSPGFGSPGFGSSGFGSSGFGSAGFGSAGFSSGDSCEGCGSICTISLGGSLALDSFAAFGSVGFFGFSALGMGSG